MLAFLKSEKQISENLVQQNLDKSQGSSDDDCCRKEKDEKILMLNKIGSVKGKCSIYPKVIHFTLRWTEYLGKSKCNSATLVEESNA